MKIQIVTKLHPSVAEQYYRFNVIEMIVGNGGTTASFAVVRMFDGNHGTVRVDLPTRFIGEDITVRNAWFLSWARDFESRLNSNITINYI